VLLLLLFLNVFVYMRFHTIINLGVVIKSVTGSYDWPKYVSLKSEIMRMCPTLTDDDIATVLPVQKLVLMEQLTLVPELGGEEWTNEVCFYLRHIKGNDESYRIIRIWTLLETAITRLVDITARKDLYAEYISHLKAKIGLRGPLNLIEARESYETHCPGTRGYWFLSQLQAEKFGILPIQARLAIYFASYGLANPPRKLARIDYEAVCLQMRNMMVSAWNSVDPEAHMFSDDYYLLAIQYAATALELVDRPMPPLK